MELGQDYSLIIKNKENLRSRLFLIFKKASMFQDFMACAKNECHTFFDRFTPEIPKTFPLDDNLKQNQAFFSKSDDFFRNVYRYFDLFPLLRPDQNFFAVVSHDNGSYPQVFYFKEQHCRDSYISSVNRLHASNINGKNISAFSDLVLDSIEKNSLVNGVLDALSGYKELDKYINRTNGVLKLLPDFSDKRPFKFKNREKLQSFLDAYTEKILNEAKKQIPYVSKPKYNCFLRLTRFDISIYFSDLPLKHAIEIDKNNYQSHLRTVDIPIEKESRLPIQSHLLDILERLLMEYSVVSEEISMLFLKKAKSSPSLQLHTSDW